MWYWGITPYNAWIPSWLKDGAKCGNRIATVTMSRLNVEDVDYDCCGFLLTSLRKRKLEYRGGRDQSGIYDSAVGEWWEVRGW